MKTDDTKKAKGCVSDDAKEIASKIALTIATLTMPSNATKDEIDLEVEAIKLYINYDAIDKYISSSFWDPAANKFKVMTPRGDLNSYTKEDAPSLYADCFGKLLNHVKIEEKMRVGLEAGYAKQHALTPAVYKREILGSAFTYVSRFIIGNKQRVAINMEVDMFAESSRVEMTNKSAKVIFAHERFKIPDSSQRIIDSLGEEKYEEAIESYKQHFGDNCDLDSFITMIVASRFASDRKKAYVWMHASSDWGKSFLLGACEALGLVVLTSVKEIEKALEGNPVGKSMYDFRGCFILAVEEFKSVKSELKQLESDIQLSPKNQLTQSVPVYMKMFLSADSVESLVGGGQVEDQFANRFSMIAKSGSIESNKLFVEIGKGAFNACLQKYICDRVNALVDGFVSLGPVNATKSADDYVVKFQGENGIDKKHQRMGDMLKDEAYEFCNFIMDIHTKCVEGAYDKNSDLARFIACKTEIEGKERFVRYYVNKIELLAERYIKTSYSGSMLGGQMKRKTDLIAAATELHDNGEAKKPIRGVFGDSKTSKLSRCNKLKKLRDLDSEDDSQSVSDKVEDKLDLEGVNF